MDGGIPLSALDPDTNGDGKVEDWESEVYNRIKAADTDNVRPSLTLFQSTLPVTFGA